MADAVSRTGLRVDLGSISDEVARKLLDRYTGMVVTIVRHYTPSAQMAFHGIDIELLVSIGQTALLEAHLSYREGDVTLERTPGSGFSVWARRIVRWRIGEVIQTALASEPWYTDRRDSSNGVLHKHVAPTTPPDVQAHHHAIGAWLKTCLARLEPRERLIIACLIRGESQVAIARSLGLSPGRVNQIVKYTLVQLRAWGKDAGFDGIGL